MKKRVLLLISFICAFSVACSKIGVQKSESLKYAYFDIGYKIENNEKIKSDYVKSLLEGYAYEKGDLTNDVKYQSHIFTNDKEKLTIYDVNNKKSLKIIYEVDNESNSILLEYHPDIDSNNLGTNVAVDNLDLYEEISTILYSKDSKFLKIYNEISKDIATTKHITVNDVEKMTTIKPLSEDVIDKDINSKTFKDGDEVLNIQSLRGQEKISRISYTLINSFFSKSTIDKELIKNGNELYASISTSVDSLSIQEQILDMIYK